MPHQTVFILHWVVVLLLSAHFPYYFSFLPITSHHQYWWLIINSARFICTVCMHRIRWSCEGLMSVHNIYTGYTLKHLLLRHMYNVATESMCYLLKPCDSETSYCWSVLRWSTWRNVLPHCTVWWLIYLLVWMLVEWYFGAVQSSVSRVKLWYL